MGEKAGDRQQAVLTLLACLIIRVGTPKDSKKRGKEKLLVISGCPCHYMIPIGKCMTSLLSFAAKISIRKQDQS